MNRDLRKFRIDFADRVANGYETVGIEAVLNFVRPVLASNTPALISVALEDQDSHFNIASNGKMASSFSFDGGELRVFLNEVNQTGPIKVLQDHHWGLIYFVPQSSFLEFQVAIWVLENYFSNNPKALVHFRQDSSEAMQAYKVLEAAGQIKI